MEYVDRIVVRLPFEIANKVHGKLSGRTFTQYVVDLIYADVSQDKTVWPEVKDNSVGAQPKLEVGLSNSPCGKKHNCSGHPNYTSIFGEELFSLKSINGNDLSTASDGRLWAPEQIIKGCLEYGLSKDEIKDVLSKYDAKEYIEFLDEYRGSSKTPVKLPNGKIAYV